MNNKKSGLFPWYCSNELTHHGHCLKLSDGPTAGQHHKKPDLPLVLCRAAMKGFVKSGLVQKYIKRCSKLNSWIGLHTGDLITLTACQNP
jgi:hypothetical protein